MPKRRPTPEISLSFLDVICCGFGAVILLLMITKTVEPQVLEESTVIAEGRVAELTEQLFEIRGETTVLNRDLSAKQEQISEFEEQIAILQGALAASNPATMRCRPRAMQIVLKKQN
jgi:2-phospho-L-lactate guanylyltransferase (CobY/MobA/RfbA family)